MQPQRPMTPPSATDALPCPLWDHELTANASPATTWLWHGFLAPGDLTLLTSLWKSGKTTLLAHLLGCRKQASQLLGLAVRPGKSVVITEESTALWAERRRQHDFGGQVCFFTRPFRQVPTAAQWQALLAQVAALHAQHGVDLLVVDPLAHFLRSESCGAGVLELLFPLRDLATRGLAVLLLHQPKKGYTLAGQAGRGHGALHSHVDISIEMQHAGSNLETRVRRLRTLSRHAETPRQLLVALKADGSAYDVLPDVEETDFQQHWDALRSALEGARCKLTRQEVLARWPSTVVKPPASTLWRWLDHALKAGLLASEGRGTQRDPFRYWLPHVAAQWPKLSSLEAFFEEDEKLKRALGLR